MIKKPGVTDLVTPGSLVRSYHLEQIEFQIIRFRDTPEDGVIRGMLSGFNLTQGDLSVGRRLPEHFLKAGGRHEMGAGTGSQITAPGK